MVLFQDYKSLFEGAGTNPGEKTLEDKFFEHEVYINFILLYLNLAQLARGSVVANTALHNAVL